MIKRVYFLAAVIKNNGAVRFHFHSNVERTSIFPKYITTNDLVEKIADMPFIMQGDKIVITSFNRIK